MLENQTMKKYYMDDYKGACYRSSGQNKSKTIKM